MLACTATDTGTHDHAYAEDTDAVAVVVAQSRQAAEDAVEDVQVEYEPLDAVVDLDQAMSGSAPAVHDGIDDNVCFRFPFGDFDATTAAFDKASLGDYLGTDARRPQDERARNDRPPTERVYERSHRVACERRALPRVFAPGRVDRR